MRIWVLAYLKFIIKFVRISFHLFKLHFMQLFIADATIFLKKNWNFSLSLKTWKLLIISPEPIFFSTCPATQTAQRQKSRTTKSPLMQDWVFRLGSPSNLLRCCKVQILSTPWMFWYLFDFWISGSKRSGSRCSQWIGGF